MQFWSRCDVPCDGLLPDKYSPLKNLDEANDVNDMEKALDKAIENFKNEIFDVAFIYHHKIDDVGHEFGPDSIETKQAVKDVDSVLRPGS